MKRSKSRKITLLNALGSIGYFICLLQWLWMLVILLPSVINSSFFKFMAPNATEVPLHPPVIQTGTTAGSVPSVVTILAVAAGICIIAAALYVIILKFPRSVANTGEKVTHTVAAVVTPLVTEHVVLPPKQRRQVPVVIIVSLKLLMVFAPLCLLLFARGLNLALSFEIIMIIGIWLFSGSFLLFAMQFILSRLMNISYRTLR